MAETLIDRACQHRSSPRVTSGTHAERTRNKPVAFGPVVTRSAPRAGRVYGCPSGSVEERLAAQAVADAAGLVDGQRRRVGVAVVGEGLGVVEQAVSQVIRGGLL